MRISEQLFHLKNKEGLISKKLNYRWVGNKFIYRAGHRKGKLLGEGGTKKYIMGRGALKS